MRKRIFSSVSVPGKYAKEHLVRLICSFSRPQDILAAYLHRPLPGVFFRGAVEQLAKGKFGKRHESRTIPDIEIVKRARTMLRWLDGEEPEDKNPYSVLGLSYSATEQQILHRYRTLSKRAHPDRHTPARQDYWCARQNEINQAYRTLSDPKSRARLLTELEQRKQLLRRLWKIEQSYRS